MTISGLLSPVAAISMRKYRRVISIYPVIRGIVWYNDKSSSLSESTLHNSAKLKSIPNFTLPSTLDQPGLTLGNN